MNDHNDIHNDNVHSYMSGLPLILVVDDEIGAEDIFEASEDIHTCWLERARKRRRKYCQNTGLVPEDDKELQIERPVARAKFISCLRWSGRLNAVPDPELLIQEILAERASAPPGYSLVLLDLLFEYGAFNQESGRFSLQSLEYGIDVLLPALRERFGLDMASPGRGWLAVPVVIVSSLSKNELEPRIRAGGARGMIEKTTSTGTLRETLRIQLSDHGLLPDERGMIAGNSFPLLNCLAAARRAAQTDFKLLLLGETGTGKELLARYVHEHSARRGGPYHVFHAPGRAETLQEDELFGHVKGAYTGAQENRPGLLELAHGGTLFVDEIADVGQTVQRALMRPVEQGKAKRIGASKEYEIDVRFVFATNKDIHHYAQTGGFMPDLLSRIEQLTIYLPPLRERKDDIPSLVKRLLAKVDAELGSTEGHFLDEEALHQLAGRSFEDSNVRALENLLRDAAISHRRDPRLTSADFRSDEMPHAQATLSREPEKSASVTDGTRRLLLNGLLTGKKEWNLLTLEEARAAIQPLRGLAPELIVRVLELSLQVCRLQDRTFSMVRVMEHFWGTKGLTSQQARRALDRILKVDTSGSVARAAASSSLLMAEPRIARAIRSILCEETGNE